MSVCDLLLHYNRHHDPQVRRAPELSWPRCIEEIGRCVAAYANSRDDDERQTLRDTMGDYALDMQCCTMTWSTPEEFFATLADFIHNRWLQTTFKHALNKLL